MYIVSIIKKFNILLSKHQKLRMAKLFVLMLIGGFLETVSVSLVLSFMDAIMDIHNVMDVKFVKVICKFLGISSPELFIVFMAVALAALYLFKNVFLMFEYYAQYEFVYGNMFNMQRRLLNTFITRPYDYYLKINSGEIIRIISNDTANAFNALVTLLSLFAELIVALMLVGTVFLISPYITLCMAALLLLLLAVIYKFVKPVLWKAGIDQQKAGAGMNKWLLQSIQGIKEIKVLRKEEFFQENYNKDGQLYIKSLRRMQTLSSAPRFIIEGICMGAMFFMVALMIYGGNEMEKLIPTLAAVALAAVRLLPSVNRISNALASMAYCEPMLDKVLENYEMLKKECAAEEKEKKEENEGGAPKLSGSILFDKVSYKYPDSADYVLKEAFFHIKEGSSVGIVGASGAGKTTTVDIILGLLCPENGKVLAGGINIHNNLERWLGKIGYIPQTIFMLDDTVKANVAFGEMEKDVSEQDVMRAVKEAALDEFVRSLPDGIYTQIGERGVRLSGGQRQRIGIARALYREPDILIMDEATSALDNDTESAIIESIINFHGKKTLIIIAHRLTTIESCDHVLRVEDGKIVQVR